MIGFVLNVEQVKIVLNRCNSSLYKDIKEIYKKNRFIINKRIQAFRDILKAEDQKDIFAEFIFCLLTPQSKAKICWDAVSRLRRKNLLCRGDINAIYKELKGVRFAYKKARYIYEARKLFMSNGRLRIRSILLKCKAPSGLRDWLVKNVKGMGYKEASHFLRNIGLGEKMGILDRHILKNLYQLNVIKEMPKTLTRKRYLTIEQALRDFSQAIKIPMSHIDLVLWCKETGEVFK